MHDGGLKGEVELKDGLGSEGMKEYLLWIIRICILLTMTGDDDRETRIEICPCNLPTLFYFATARMLTPTIRRLLHHQAHFHRLLRITDLSL